MIICIKNLKVVNDKPLSLIYLF